MNRAPFTGAGGMTFPKNINQWADIQDVTLFDRDQCVCQFCKSEMSYIATAPLKDDRLRYACEWCGQRWNVKVEMTPIDTPNEAHPNFGMY